MYICHVCGYDQITEPPWGEDGNIPSYNICNCCSIEYGIEDYVLLGLEHERKQWIEKESEKWLMEDQKPLGWDKQAQIKNIELIEERLLPYYLQNKS